MEHHKNIYHRNTQYGEFDIIKTISKELKNELDTGFDERILRDSRRFYLCFKGMESGTHCVPNLIWSHYRVILFLSDKNAAQVWIKDCGATGATIEQDQFFYILLDKPYLIGYIRI